MLVQLFIIYFGLAQLDWLRASYFWVILKEPFWCAIIAFSLNTGAYTLILDLPFKLLKRVISRQDKVLVCQNLKYLTNANSNSN